MASVTLLDGVQPEWIEPAPTKRTRNQMHAALAIAYGQKQKPTAEEAMMAVGIEPVWGDLYYCLLAEGTNRHLALEQVLDYRDAS